MPKGLPPIAIVVSRYNGPITSTMLDGAVGVYVEQGGRREDLKVLSAPGSFEIVPLVAGALSSGRYAGVVAIGCIIRGATMHDVVLGHAVTDALAHLAAVHASPVGLAVLTVNTQKQALERAGGREGNKGAEAMLATLQTLASLHIAKTGRPDRALSHLPSPGATAPSKVARAKGAK